MEMEQGDETQRIEVKRFLPITFLILAHSSSFSTRQARKELSHPAHVPFLHGE